MRHSKERVRKYGEVFTPEWLVKQMCDEVSHDYYDAAHTFLEPSCGTGNFIVEILARKMNNIANISSKKKYLRSSIQVLSSIYGVELLHDNIVDCRKRTYKLWKSLARFELDKDILAVAKAVIKTNLIWGDFIKKTNLKTGLPLSFVLYNWNEADAEKVTVRLYKMEDMQNTISFTVPSVSLGTCYYKDLPCLIR